MGALGAIALVTAVRASGKAKDAKKTAKAAIKKASKGK